MKFTINQKTLNEQITILSRAVPNRPTHPVLGNILFVATEGKVTMTGFDLSLGIRVEIPADVITEGSIAIPAKLLGEIVGRAEGEIAIAVEFDDEPNADGMRGAKVTLKILNGEFNIRGMDAQEYPAFPAIENKPIALPVSVFMAGLDVNFATSQDDTKQVLTGVHITQKTDAIEFAATDGHRLAVITAPDEDLPKLDRPLEVTIPGRTISELSRIIATSDVETISLKLDDSIAIAEFEIGDYLLTTRVLSGAYPAYNQLLPKHFEGFATVDRAEMVKAIEAVGCLLSDKNSLIQFQMNESNITIAAEAQDLGSGVQSIGAEVTGENLSIGFNSKYLLGGLKEFRHKTVRMNYNQPTHPVVFDFSIGGIKINYLVMPVQIRK